MDVIEATQVKSSVESKQGIEEVKKTVATETAWSNPKQLVGVLALVGALFTAYQQYKGNSVDPQTAVLLELVKAKAADVKPATVAPQGHAPAPDMDAINKRLDAQDAALKAIMNMLGKKVDYDVMEVSLGQPENIFEQVARLESDITALKAAAETAKMNQNTAAAMIDALNAKMQKVQSALPTAQSWSDTPSSGASWSASPMMYQQSTSIRRGLFGRRSQAGSCGAGG